MMVPPGCAVRLIDLPYKVGAMVAFDEEGFASIYLNARWPQERQRAALQHELRHIEHDDIHNDKDIKAVEREADGIDRRQVQRDIAKLYRLGVLCDLKHDPLLNLPEY